MVIWHPNVAVEDLGYRGREVNQWQVLQPEKLANTSINKVSYELCWVLVHHEVKAGFVQKNVFYFLAISLC